MLNRRKTICGVPLLLSLVVSLGCKPETTASDSSSAENTQDAPAQTAGDGHHHDHGDLGPHGGHLLHLEPTGAHAEWTHDDETSTIKVYLDKEEAEAAKQVQFVVQIGDEREEFELQREKDAWSISSEALMAHLNMGDAVQSELIIVTDDQRLSAPVEAHEEHHHH